ncbi:MAG: sulfite exporter TauE/SafE family protein [Pseudomonadota bacterium]
MPASVIEILPFALLMASAGVLAGFMAGLFGIGGGAILVPVFYQAFGWAEVPEAVRMHLSVGTSLAIIAPTSIRSFLAHRAAGAVDLDTLRTFVIAIPLGVLIASIVIAGISSGGLRLVFAILAVLVGLKLLFDQPDWRLGSDLPDGPFRFLAGGTIGFLSTLMGIGGGVLNNTFMTLYGRPIHQAIATSSGVGVLISVPGLIGAVWAGWGEVGLPALSTGFVNWLCFAVVIPATLAFAPVGARLAHRTPKRVLEKLFGLFMLAVALRFFISVAGH